MFFINERSVLINAKFQSLNFEFATSVFKMSP